MQRTQTVLDVSGGVTGAVAPGLGQVQLCTLCARCVKSFRLAGLELWRFMAVCKAVSRAW